MRHSGTLYSRRHFLAQGGMGLGGIALAWLLNQEAVRADAPKPDLERHGFDLKPKPPHYPPRAKAMISLWMQGGPSHIDLYDPKPELAKWDGKDFAGALQYDFPNDASKKVLASPWKFKKHGQCGMELSELLPHMSEVVDDLTLVRSLSAPGAHLPGIRAFQNGDSSGQNGGNSGRASLGSWISYALGSESQDLPAFVALTDTPGTSSTSGETPLAGVENWSNGFLPSLYQGTLIRALPPRIANLDPPPHLMGEPQASALAFLERMNRRHLHERRGNDDLEARIASFELAARMQLAAAEAMDLSKETKETQRLYGLDEPATREYGANCLLARRLIERGVRFVQVYVRSQFWDHHYRIFRELPEACQRTDKPSAALVKDLKRRGLLDTTIVQWGGEMGRLPVIQAESRGRDGLGRDHNIHGFGMWLAGGGFKGGHIHGATDDFGHKAIKDPVSHSDYHATLLHLFGLDHERLTFNLAGREHHLGDGRQKGRIVRELLENSPAQT